MEEVEVKDSPTLRRLIEEVRREQADSPNSYNRFHNRHNRSGDWDRLKPHSQAPDQSPEAPSE